MPISSGQKLERDRQRHRRSGAEDPTADFRIRISERTRLGFQEIARLRLVGTLYDMDSEAVLMFGSADDSFVVVEKMRHYVRWFPGDADGLATANALLSDCGADKRIRYVADGTGVSAEAYTPESKLAYRSDPVPTGTIFYNKGDEEREFPRECVGMNGEMVNYVRGELVKEEASKRATLRGVTLEAPLKLFDVLFFQ